MVVYAALDRWSVALAQDDYNLIGGDAMVTMRGVAKDIDQQRKHLAGSGLDRC